MRARIERAELTDRIRGSAGRRPGPLPFADGEFDVVFSKDSLVQIPDKPAIFAQILRVLRPGGRFIASDWLRGGGAEYSAEMLEFFRLEGIAYNMATLAESAAALLSGRLQRALRFAIGMTGISISRSANSRPWRGPSMRMIVDRIGRAAGTAFHRQLAAAASWC